MFFLNLQNSINPEPLVKEIYMLLVNYNLTGNWQTVALGIICESTKCLWGWIVNIENRIKLSTSQDYLLSAWNFQGQTASDMEIYQYGFLTQVYGSLESIHCTHKLTLKGFVLWRGTNHKLDLSFYWLSLRLKRFLGDLSPKVVGTSVLRAFWIFWYILVVWNV